MKLPLQIAVESFCSTCEDVAQQIQGTGKKLTASGRARLRKAACKMTSFAFDRYLEGVPESLIAEMQELTENWLRHVDEDFAKGIGELVRGYLQTTLDLRSIVRRTEELQRKREGEAR